MSLSVLVLYDIRSESQKRVAILDHVRFLDHAPEGAVRLSYLNMAERPAFDPRWLEHDVIVLHTTLLCWRWQAHFPALAGQLDWMHRFDGVVVALPQDEYDHAHTLDDWLARLRVKVVVTVLAESHRILLYPQMHDRAFFIEGLTGYVHPERAAAAAKTCVPLEQRTHDVVYRANNLPYWFGWLGQIKSRLGTEGARVLSRGSLRTDISIRPSDTVLGDGWISFLSGSVSILGSESGSSVLDRRGEVAAHIRALLAERPGLTFEDADAFSGGELTRFHFAAIGPRHLEAIMTGTVQLLVEGSYGGHFTPWEHYIPLQRDLSDLHRVPEYLADRSMVQRIIERARADFIESGSHDYAVLARNVIDVAALFRTLEAQSATTSASASVRSPTGVPR